MYAFTAHDQNLPLYALNDTLFKYLRDSKFCIAKHNVHFSVPYCITGVFVLE